VSDSTALLSAALTPFAVGAGAVLFACGAFSLRDLRG
jgi:hypothetical protein